MQVSSIFCVFQISLNEKFSKLEALLEVIRRSCAMIVSYIGVKFALTFTIYWDPLSTFGADRILWAHYSAVSERDRHTHTHTNTK